MPVPKLTLDDALGRLQALGRARITLGNGAAVATLEGPLSFSSGAGPEVVLNVGCTCTVRLPRDRIRHAVLSEKDAQGQVAVHVQLFDGNYDKLVAFVFPEGVAGARALVATLDGNDFEIG